MRVTDLQLAGREGLTRASARLAFEDRDAPDDILWFDLPAAVAGEVEPSANAFLPSALAHAMQKGERRVVIDGAVCPRHLEGLRTVAAIFSWWYPELTAPQIETTVATSAPTPTARRSAICLSGGVDAFAALQENHLTIPRDHPGFLQDALLYFGLNSYDFDTGPAGAEPNRERLLAFDAHRQRLEKFGEQTGVTLIPVRTNVRALYASWKEWRAVGLTAALVAAAHALPHRVRALTIASNGLGISSHWIGTHPMLDPHFSSLALDVRTMHSTLPRWEKVRRVAEWPEALAALRVCFMIDIPGDGTLNCGRCEKCVRTMLELLLCGALGRASTFPRDDVTPDMIMAIPFAKLAKLFFLQFKDGLASIGRHDLVRAIDEQIAMQDRSERGEARHRWRRWLRFP